MIDREVLAGRCFAGAVNRSGSASTYTGMTIANPVASGVLVQVDYLGVFSQTGGAGLFRLTGVGNADYSELRSRHNSLIGGAAHAAEVAVGRSGSLVIADHSLRQRSDVAGTEFEMVGPNVGNPKTLKPGEVLVLACDVLDMTLYFNLEWREVPE